MILLAAFMISISSLDAVLPGEIDPMDTSSGDFLDIDLNDYQQYAMDAYSGGNYSLAARYFLAYLSRNISEEDAIYNLACCYALLGEAQLSALYLRRAVTAGYSDIGYIRQDSDFDGVWDDPVFSETVELIAGVLGEPPQFTGDVILFEAGSAHRCLLRFPEDFDDTQNAYTLVIGLHGYGDSPESFIRLWGYFDSPDFIYACPCAPYSMRENGVPGYSWFRMGSDSIETMRLDLVSADYVVSAVEYLRSRYNISDVFLLGFSQGCGLTWLTGLTHPREFSGLIGMGGRLDPSFIPDSLIGEIDGLFAFVANGTQDESVDFALGAAAIEILENLGVHVTFSAWDGPHRINRAVLLEAQNWMNTLP